MDRVGRDGHTPSSARKVMRAAIVVALLLLLGACGEAPTIENLGLDVSVDIQSGTTFEMAVPMWDDATVGVLMTPAGVFANFQQVNADGEQVLRIDVRDDVQAGPYTLVLQAERGGEAHLLDWPFWVVDSSDS